MDAQDPRDEETRPQEGSQEEPRPDAEDVLPSHFRTPDVQELVEKAQGGDVEALNDLFTRYYDSMLDVARRRLGPRLRQKEEADDLAQTTFREATRDFAQYQYRGEGSLLRWLMQILRNKIRDKAEYYSAGKRDVSRETSADDSGTSDDGPARRLEAPSPDLSVTRFVQRGEEVDILREALGKLSSDHRRAITLVFFQGLTLRQAGDMMGGRTEDAVRMLLRRAESRLRELTQSRLTK